MSIVPVKAQMTTSQLLKAVEQMPARELDQFVEQVVALRSALRAPKLAHSEAELLTKINQGVPADLQSRYDELIAKRRESTLTRNEYDELLQLTEQVEAVDVRRVEHLAELARLRKTTLRALMNDLGIKTPPHA